MDSSAMTELVIRGGRVEMSGREAIERRGEVEIWRDRARREKRSREKPWCW